MQLHSFIYIALYKLYNYINHVYLEELKVVFLCFSTTIVC